MSRMLIAGLAAVAALAAAPPAALAADPEARAAQLAELLPKPHQGWTSTGAKTAVVPTGPTRGAAAFRIYQQAGKTVIIRLTENPPELLVRILKSPKAYGYRETSYNKMDAVVRDQSDKGAMLLPVKKFLVSVDWSGQANQDEAIRYLKSVNLRKLSRLD